MKHARTALSALAIASLTACSATGPVPATWNNYRERPASVATPAPSAPAAQAQPDAPSKPAAKPPAAKPERPARPFPERKPPAPAPARPTR